VHLCWARNIILRLRSKSWANHSAKTYFKKIKNSLEKIEGRKQLETFLGRLTYALDFIKDLTKLRIPLQ